MAFGLRAGVYRLAVEYTQLGSTNRNSFHYWNVSDEVSSAAAEELAGAFIDGLLDGGIEQGMRNSVNFTGISVVAVADGTSYFEDSLDIDGGRVGTSAPGFVTATFTFKRPTPAYRNGYKRFGGLATDQMSGNTFVDTGGHWATVKALLDNDLLGATYTFRPVVPRGVTQGDGRLDCFDIEIVLGPNLGTQNTRKAGVGI